MIKFLKLKLLIALFCLTNSIFGQNIHPEVIAIYPKTDSIPVNILRFYIQFSKPMQEMNILQHVHLTNSSNQDLTGVFYENQYELWNENRTMVTIIVDPGRVKTGLLANNKMGRAFDEGIKYSLTVDNSLLDFNDQKLGKSFTKTFVAVKEDRLAPDTKKWDLTLPKKNTKEEIEIHFNDKIDPISATTLIKIYKGNKEIKGAILLKKKEKAWLFQPLNEWEIGEYQIVVNPRLEDIAANSLTQIFDHKASDFTQNNNKNIILKFKII